MISARLGYRLTPQTKRGAAVSALTTLIAIGGQEGFLSDSVFRRAQSKTAVYFSEPSSIGIDTFKVENAVLLYFRNAHYRK